MKRKGLVVAAAVVAAVLVLLLALPLLVNAEAFRPVVEAQLRAALGRSVEIGRLRLALLSGGIEADRIVIADDPQFSRAPFLQAESLTVGAELLPLVLSRSLRITGITLRAPQLTLLR